MRDIASLRMAYKVWEIKRGGYINMKFSVNIDCDYVMGHLRYGHLEGEVEAESEEKLKEMIKDGSINDYLKLVVDSYSVDDYEADWNSVKYTQI